MATAAQPPDSSPEREQQPTTVSQRARLEELIPAGATSTEKRELLAGSEAVFSGRCDPAAVRCLWRPSMKLTCAGSASSYATA